MQHSTSVVPAGQGEVMASVPEVSSGQVTAVVVESVNPAVVSSHVAAEHPTNNVLVVSVDAHPIDQDLEIGSPDSTVRPEFSSATVFKRSGPDSTSLGIEVAKDASGDIRISAIQDSSAFSASPLRVGDQVLSVNGKLCTSMERQDVGALLRQIEGLVTVVVRHEGGSSNLVEAMVEKPAEDIRVGIGMGRNARGSLEISKITATGLFAHSLLNAGDRVISINGIGCQTLEPRAALDIIRRAPRYVTILTETQNSTGVVLAVSRSRPDGTVIAGPAMYMMDDIRRFQNQACWCTWMLILSLLIVSAAVFFSEK